MLGKIGVFGEHLLSIYDLTDNELYRRTPSDVMLKCLDLDDAILAMTEVHERHLWYLLIGSKNEVGFKKGWVLLAQYDC
jgi:hypothetical protein